MSEQPPYAELPLAALSGAPERQVRQPRKSFLPQCALDPSVGRSSAVSLRVGQLQPDLRLHLLRHLVLEDQNVQISLEGLSPELFFGIGLSSPEKPVTCERPASMRFCLRQFARGFAARPRVQSSRRSRSASRAAALG